MVCPNCGMENEEGLAACAQCGEPMNQPKANYGKDFAWAALVLGILSFVIFPYLYAPLSVIAAILSRRQDYEGKMPIVGMALGLVALVGWAAFRIFA